MKKQILLQAVRPKHAKTACRISWSFACDVSKYDANEHGSQEEEEEVAVVVDVRGGGGGGMDVWSVVVVVLVDEAPAPLAAAA